MPTFHARKAALALCFAGAFLLLAGSNAFAQTLSSYNTELLAQAEQAYNTGRYNESIKLAGKQLHTPGTSPVERVQAYRLQGLSYSAQGKERKARRAAQDLVILYPTYEPSPQDSPAFVALIEDAQARHASGELKQQDQRRTNRFLLGTTIALSILTIAVGIQSAMMM